MDAQQGHVADAYSPCLTNRVRFGLLSDIHANLPALRATLAVLQRLGVDRYVCAGDVVGYGPHPRECIELVETLQPVWVLGNHELMLLGRLPTANATPLVRTTLEWTRSVLSAEIEQRLSALPMTAEFGDGAVVTHGSLADPSSRVRVRRRQEIVAELERLRRDYPGARLLVLGHTHCVMVASRQTVLRLASLRERIALQPAVSYIINPGSVGQSRGFIHGARAAVLDTEANTIQLVRARYDTATLIRDLAEVGFPPWSYHDSPVRRMAERAQRRVRALVALHRASTTGRVP